MSKEAIDITSNALVLVGDKPISAWDESDSGVASEAFYLETKNAMLEEFPWSWALIGGVLNGTEINDQYRPYKYRFTLTPEMLRLWRIYPHSNYGLEGRYVYSNQTSLYAVGVYSVSELLFSPKFKESIEYRLAMKFAIAIVEDNERMALMKEQYEQCIRMARHIDSTQRPQRAIVDQPFSDVRLSGFDGSSYYG